MLAKTPKDLGILIREQRRQLGLDQRALAQRVGVSRQWIVEVEGGKPRAEVGLVLRTLAALELEVDVARRGEIPIPTTSLAVDLDSVIAKARKPKP